MLAGVHPLGVLLPHTHTPPEAEPGGWKSYCSTKVERKDCCRLQHRAKKCANGERSTPMPR